MSARATKRPSRAKQPWEKMIAINRVTEGESKAAVARDMDVPESTLRGWCKNKEKIEALSKQARASPNSAVSSVTSGSGEVRIKLDNDMPQNMSIRSSTPNEPDKINTNQQVAIDLSRTSPLASNNTNNNGVISAAYLEAARLFQTMHYNFLAGNNRVANPVSRSNRNGVPNLPNEPLPAEVSVRQWLNSTNSSQVSPNSSSATLSSPHIAQQTTSPLAGITPEQQNFYREMYRAMIYSATLTSPLNALQQQFIQNGSQVAPASYPVSPKQTASAATSSERPSVSTDNSQVPLIVPSQPIPSSTIYQNSKRHSTTPSANGQRNFTNSYFPNTSAQSFYQRASYTPSASLCTNPQLFYPEHAENKISSRPQSCSSSSYTSSTLDLSMKTNSVKSEPTENEIAPVSVKQEPMDLTEPSEVTNERSNDVIIEPEKECDELNMKTSDLQNVTSDPQNVTSDPQNETIDPHNEIIDPQNSTIDQQAQENSDPTYLDNVEVANKESVIVNGKIQPLITQRRGAKRSLDEMVDICKSMKEESVTAKKLKFDDLITVGEVFLEQLHFYPKRLTASRLVNFQKLLDSLKEAGEEERN